MFAHIYHLAAPVVIPKKKISMKDVENEIDSFEEFINRHYEGKVDLPDNWEEEFQDIDKYVSIEVQLKELEDYFNQQLAQYENK